MEEINVSLLKDEKILWHRSKEVNLLNFIPKGILFIIIFTLICGIFILFQIFLSSLFGLSLIIFVTIIANVSMIIVGFREFKNRRKVLNINFTNLKRFETYDILTNKRYIRRDYRLNYNKNLDFSLYSSEVLSITDDHILILKFDFVIKLVLDKIDKIIYFLVKNENDEDIADVYIECSDEEVEEIINILKKVLKLEEKKQTINYIEYQVQLPL